MIDSEKLKAILEAALLAADEPLTVDQFAKLFRDGELDKENLRADIREALKVLESEVEGRGYELIRVASGYRFQVRQELSTWVSRLWEEKPPRYSRALLETLALIAYKQPVTRGDIEEVRGVSVSQSIMRTLVERGWIRVVGQREVPGHPAMYGTTRAFLDYFNLKSLDQLPPLPEIRELIEPVIVAENPEEARSDAPAPDPQEDLEATAVEAEAADNAGGADIADHEYHEDDQYDVEAAAATAAAETVADPSDQLESGGDAQEEAAEPAAVVEVGEVAGLTQPEQSDEASGTAEVVQLPTAKH